MLKKWPSFEILQKVVFMLNDFVQENIEHQHKTYPEKGSDHRAHLNRLKRIEGQLKTIITNVEQEKYCIGIINQVKSIRSALQSFEMEIIKGHLNGCLKKSLLNPNDGDIDSKLQEVLAIFEKANKV